VMRSTSNREATTRQPHRQGVHGNERMNALSDGVFAIVVTLLLLEIKVPQVPPPQLVHALTELLPKVMGHIISFVVLGIYWVGHHNMFLHVKRHDRVLLWLNILFLLVVAIMPFPTELVIQYLQEQVAVVVYAATLVLAGLTLDLMWWYATHNHRLVHESLSQDLIAFVHRRVLIAPALYLVAIAVSFASVLLAQLIFVLVVLLYIVPNPLDHHHHKQLSIHEPEPAPGLSNNSSLEK
jgi:uncharacterized membrane protein